MIGTSFTCLRASSVALSATVKYPSISGGVRMPRTLTPTWFSDCAARIRSAGILRMSSRLAAPRRFCNSRPACSAVARSGPAVVKLQALHMAAPLNKPFERGLKICAATEPAPKDWPVMTTLPGSPPKAAMLS